MAAIVCHGLQSCLDSQLVESRIHGLRLPSPKPLLTPQPIDLAPFTSCFWESNTKPHCEENSYKTDTVHHNPISSNSNPNQGGSWSSIQALSNVSQDPKEPTYVHPQVKLSWLRLSPKSLELCTENLGNETGTEITESGIDLLSSTDSAGGYLGTTKEEETKARQVLGAKKEKAKNFPPPLTTIRGSEALRVKPHREGGRLVIEVTKVPSSAPCFQAERSHGRLRLCFWTDPEDDDNNQGFQEEEEEEEEEEGVEEGFDAENENEGGGRDTCLCEETKGNSYWSTGSSDMRMQKYERLSRRRCKEGDHENNELLLNWGEPLWVATS